MGAVGGICMGYKVAVSSRVEAIWKYELPGGAIGAGIGALIGYEYNAVSQPELGRP